MGWVGLLGHGKDFALPLSGCGGHGVVLPGKVASGVSRYTQHKLIYILTTAAVAGVFFGSGGRALNPLGPSLNCFRIKPLS